MHSGNFIIKSLTLDVAGQPVDWFIMIKQQGKYTYAYADNRAPGLVPSPHSLNGTGAVVLSINAALAQSYAMYNDQPPVSGVWDRGRKAVFLDPTTDAACLDVCEIHYINLPCCPAPRQRRGRARCHTPVASSALQTTPVVDSGSRTRCRCFLTPATPTWGRRDGSQFHKTPSHRFALGVEVAHATPSPCRRTPAAPPSSTTRWLMLRVCELRCAGSRGRTSALRTPSCV